jgi:hypothetical protein
MSNLTTAEFERLRNRAITKFKELGYKSVVESIYKFRPANLQSRLNEAWACLYVINSYVPGDDDNYLTETELLKINDRLQRIWI